jgi:hypothetical protein
MNNERLSKMLQAQIELVDGYPVPIEEWLGKTYPCTSTTSIKNLGLFALKEAKAALDCPEMLSDALFRGKRSLALLRGSWKETAGLRSYMRLLEQIEGILTRVQEITGASA